MNPMNLLKLRLLLKTFNENHPKVLMFLKAAYGTVQVGSIVELKITPPDGHSIITNIKVNEQDMELIRELQNLRS